MFATPDQMPDQGLPQFETRKALIVLGMQNDLFYVKDDFHVTKNPEIIARIKEIVPYFRKQGDIIWVVSETGSLPSTQTKDPSRVEGESAKLAEKNRKTRMKEESHLEDDVSNAGDDASDEGIGPDQSIYPSSRARDRLTLASAGTRNKKRTADSEVLGAKEDALAEHLTKPRKGQKSQFCIAGTKGAEICTELKDMIDESQDMIVTKHFYSAFDQTSLLMSLRMSLTTEIYLCGTFTNTSVYSTAADAVQHGLQVTVVEDCLGYRNEEKHDEAMRQMSDIMGVNGIDSEEVILEAGGREIPDAETPGVTLQDLSIGLGATAAQASLVAQAQQGSGTGRGMELSAAASTVKESATQNAKGGLRGGYSPKPSAEPASRSDGQAKTRPKANTLGAAEVIGSGDSRIIPDALSPQLSGDIFNQLKEEVNWQKMYHRSGEVPRLVAVQGAIGKDGEVPVYRHPADESPPLRSFSPTLQKIRKEVEQLLSQPFNHALIQLYRGGEDNISEHADKTLDIVQDSSIINVSLGAQRVMTLRTKKASNRHSMESVGVRQSQRIKMPHNSVFVLGPQTNREWLHGVRADKRPVQEKTEEELSFDGERISITFRRIGTFMDDKAKRIWGSGAKSKTRTKAGRISTDDTEMDLMIKAFGKENHQPDFDWEDEYGSGFDVVNLMNREAQLIPCEDPVANLRARLALSYKSVPYKVVEGDRSGATKFIFHPWTHGLSNLEKPILKQIGQEEAETEGDLAILFHLEKQRPSADLEGVEGYTNAQLFRCATQSNELLYMWRELQANPPSSPTHRYRLERPTTPKSPLLKEIEHVVQSWEDYLEEEEYLFVAGEAWTILDCAFWPVLHCIFTEGRSFGPREFPCLMAYHRRGLQKAEAAKALKGRE